MNADQAREYLAMKGAQQVLEELDEARTLAWDIYKHAERLTNSGSASQSVPTLCELLTSARNMLAGIKVQRAIASTTPAEVAG